MPARVFGVSLRGLDARPVEVQVDLSPGKPGVYLVGLAAASVREARERVRSAMTNTGCVWPGSHGRVTVNLAPAEMRKDGGGLDLALAVAIFLATVGRQGPADVAFIGELSLDGTLRPTQGVLVAALALARLGFREIFVPRANAAEAALQGETVVHPCPDLTSVIRHLRGEERIEPFRSPPRTTSEPRVDDDLAEVQGQEAARRALEVAAAGGHHILFTGPPGAGKTMLARCLPGILPPLAMDEALEIAQVRSVLGELDPARPLDWNRPFRSPHHSVSGAGLVGGGLGLARPGEISRATHGVLFLDELAEFRGSVLQNLRQPIERGTVTITRSDGAVTYPCRFMLVAATNPCPCGWWGDPRVPCRCTPAAAAAYQRALTGPLLDRIDIRVNVNRLDVRLLSVPGTGEPSSAVRARVVEARARQTSRQGGLNSTLRPRDLKRLAPLDAPGQRTLERWAEVNNLTARGFHRAWRVARTIADLAGADPPREEHVLEALGYRLQEVAA